MSSPRQQLPARNAQGAFATARNPVDLYTIVRDVAIAAANADPDPLKNPAEVSERAWEAASASFAATWGKVPKARQICVDLRDRDLVPYKWRDLLAVVFREGIDYTQHHAQRTSARDRILTDDHVFWALNLVAHFLGLRSLRPHEYVAGRRQLLDKHAQGTRECRYWENALPTANQLEAHCGTWDAALDVAQLVARADHAPRRAVPRVAELIGFFFLRHGYLPSQKQFRDFLNDEDLACEAWQRQPWKSRCIEASDLLEAQGTARPRPYPSKTPPDGWEALDVDLSELPRRGIAEYSHLQALNAVYEFKVNLERGATPSDKRYQEYASGRPGVPSLPVLERWGGLQAVLREVAIEGWRERATAEQQAFEEAAAAEQAVLAAQKKARPRQAPRRDPETKMRLLRLLEKQGPLASRNIVDALSLSRMAVRENAAELEDLGLVTGTVANLKSPNRRYVLTPAGIEALEDEEALREMLATYRPPIDQQSPGVVFG